MARFQKTIEAKEDLTTIIVSGKVSTPELMDALKDFYNDKFTAKLLWDFSDADFDADFHGAPAYAGCVLEKLRAPAQGGKTAFVLSDGYWFGMGRMFETLSVLSQHAVLYNVFKTNDEAKAWLNG